MGTSSEVMIFDIRQMKEPRIKIDPRLGTMANEPRQINVSWSPNGKYIFIHGPELPEVNDQPGQSIFCFWDVQNEKLIGMSVDVTSPMERQWNGMPVPMWIDDNLVVGSRSGPFSGVHSMVPNSSKTENINDFEVDSNGVGACVIDSLAYNEKTLQLAGADKNNIFVWSHYKLPPYPPIDEDRLDDLRLQVDDSETRDTGLINDLGLEGLALAPPEVQMDPSMLQKLEQELKDAQVIHLTIFHFRI